MRAFNSHISKTLQNQPINVFVQIMYLDEILIFSREVKILLITKDYIPLLNLYFLRNLPGLIKVTPTVPPPTEHEIINNKRPQITHDTCFILCNIKFPH